MGLHKTKDGSTEVNYFTVKGVYLEIRLLELPSQPDLMRRIKLYLSDGGRDD